MNKLQNNVSKSKFFEFGAYWDLSFAVFYKSKDFNIFSSTALACFYPGA